MSNHLSETENSIISKTKELIYREGKIKATSQEIADYSGVKRTLVNYYFRSKANLMMIVYSEIVAELHEGLNEIYLKKDTSFEDKIDYLLEFTFVFKRQYPFFEVISINMSNNLLEEDIYVKPIASKGLDEFMKDIQKQMDAGVIQKSSPINFMINIFSLISYPLVMRGIYKDVFGISEAEFEQILVDRKNVIKSLIFNK